MWLTKKVRIIDLLKKHFGEGPDGPTVVAANDQFVRSYPWVRFTCRGLDYAVERERVDHGYSVEVGRADRPGRPDDASVFNSLSIEGVQAYNKDMFYWQNIQEALGDPEASRSIRRMNLGEILATLGGLETGLQALFSGEAYEKLYADRERRIDELKAIDAGRRGPC